MAEIQSGGDDHGKGKKGRKKGGNPRVDMTPMVDLAFLLLTFFVLTSNLNKAKTMEMAVPKENKDTSTITHIDDDYAYTILIDGNKEGKFYVYHGQLHPKPPKPEPQLEEYTMDPKQGLRAYMLSKNTKVTGEMKTLRTIYKSGKFDEADYAKLKAILVEKKMPNPDPQYRDTVVERRKNEDYAKAIARMDKDLVKKEMNDTTYKFVASNIRDDAHAPFFIVKWGGDAKYSDLINIIDELKIADISKYALVKISRPEYEKLATITHRNYAELSQPDPNAPK
jgi:biopolymer transport protein ExbD